MFFDKAENKDVLFAPCRNGIVRPGVEVVKAGELGMCVSMFVNSHGQTPSRAFCHVTSLEDEEEWVVPASNVDVVNVVTDPRMFPAVNLTEANQVQLLLCNIKLNLMHITGTRARTHSQFDLLEYRYYSWLFNFVTYP